MGIVVVNLVAEGYLTVPENEEICVHTELNWQRINKLLNNAFAVFSAMVLFKSLSNYRLEKPNICVIDYLRIGIWNISVAARKILGKRSKRGTLIMYHFYTIANCIIKSMVKVIVINKFLTRNKPID